MYPYTWESQLCFQTALEINLKFTDVSELIKLERHRTRQIEATGSDQTSFSWGQEGGILLPGALKRYQEVFGAASPLPCPRDLHPGTKGSDVSPLPGPAPTAPSSLHGTNVPSRNGSSFVFQHVVLSGLSRTYVPFTEENHCLCEKTHSRLECDTAVTTPQQRWKKQ